MTADQSLALFLKNVGFFVRNFEYDPRRGNDFKININVDAKSLVAAGGRLKELVKTSPHIFRNLVFEITEETLSEISNAQLKVLYKLSLIGAQFSIDDFGAGLSNFARLSRLPFCEIKIDRSIVHGCSTVQARRIMVKSIVNMAHDMGVKSVAEGVETLDDFSFIEEVKCDEAQGYLIGRPMKLDKFRSFTDEFNGNLKDRKAGLSTSALP
jgi:EAL domain-containing protein (putative c-di-GMP-specific phosphodiesterase class I)